MSTVNDDLWGTVRGRLSGLPGGAGVNIAYEAVDRHDFVAMQQQHGDQCELAAAAE